MKKFRRPVIIVSLNQGMGKGSGRSIPGVNLCRALSLCSDKLIDFGGHSMAAGLQIYTKNLPAFQDKFNRIIGDMTEPNDFQQVLSIDCELQFAEITGKLLDQLELLEPFGAANSEPLFVARNVIASDVKRVGGNHFRMRLSQSADPSGKTFRAIQFNVEKSQVLPSTLKRLAFHLRWNRWNGVKTPQLIVEALE